MPGSVMVTSRPNASSLMLFRPTPAPPVRWQSCGAAPSRPAPRPAHAQQNGWTGVVKLGGSKKKKAGKKQPQNTGSSQGDQQPHPSPPTTPPAASTPSPDPLWRLSVVQVLATHQPPHPTKPWSQTVDYHSCSSAVIVNATQRLLITTAGAVHYAAWSHSREASVVQVYIPTHGVVVPAQVLVVAQDADLALLQLDPLPSAHRSTAITGQHLPAQQPHIQGHTGPHSSATRTLPASLHAVIWAKGMAELGVPIFAAGFPASGRFPGQVSQVDDAAASVCVTRGVTSRLEVITYAHSGRKLLGLQIDAAVNQGCWGGGVFNTQGHCLGLLLQRSSSHSWRARYSPSPGSSTDTTWGEAGENVAYVVPASIISHFLTDVKRHRGGYKGFPCLGFDWQPLVSPALRQYTAVPGGVQGVRVTRCDCRQPSWHVLQPGDVVTHVGGHAVSATGHVHLPQQPTDNAMDTPTATDASISSAFQLSHVAAAQQVDSDLEIQILRQGVPMTFQIRLAAPKPLVPWHAGITHDTSAGAPRARHNDPAHVFLPPFAFVAATVPLLQQLYRSRAHIPQEPGRQHPHRKPGSTSAQGSTPPPSQPPDEDQDGISHGFDRTDGVGSVPSIIHSCLAVTRDTSVSTPSGACSTTGVQPIGVARQNFKCTAALLAAVHGCDAVDLTSFGADARAVHEIVLLVGKSPAWANASATANNDHMMVTPDWSHSASAQTNTPGSLQNPRDGHDDDVSAMLDCELKPPRWLVRLNDVAVHSVGHLRQLVALHEGGRARLEFACGRVAYVDLPRAHD